MKFYDWLIAKHPESIAEEKSQWTSNRFSKNKPYYKNSRSRRLDIKKKREELKNREEE